MYTYSSLMFYQHFMSHASDELQGLFSLHANTLQVFTAMVQYFGEDPKLITTCDMFGIFAEFMNKFEVSGICLSPLI